MKMGYYLLSKLLAFVLVAITILFSESQIKIRIVGVIGLFSLFEMLCTIPFTGRSVPKRSVEK